jgi:signal transduction histidine kinase
MLRFRDLPIRRKLMAFILFVSCLSLLAAIFAVVGYQRSVFKRRAVRDLESRAEMIGASTSAALDFDDQKLARDILQTLISSREILSACIYAKDGSVFASYARREAGKVIFPPPRPDSHEFQDAELRLFRRIRSGQETIGTVYLQYALAQASAQVRSEALISIIIIVALASLSFLLSFILQRTISAPLMRLAAAAKAITTRRDYSLRVPKETNDEIGQLTDAFNQMLAIVREREEELEKRVAERTAQLERNAKKLEQSVGEMQHISYSLTHDMRAPLRAMHHFTQLLLEENGPNLNHTGREYIQRILASSTRLDNLIQDALTYTEVAGSPDVKLRPVDSGALLREMVASYPQFHPPNAEVRLEGELPRVMGNQAWLTQCFSNLLQNAAKFKTPGTVAQVKVRAEVADASIRFWVEDHGIGIPQAAQKRIFDMFQRAHAGYEGTGIGLAIVRKIVERMGGKVGVDSEPGQGSRFWVELPAARTDESFNA